MYVVWRAVVVGVERAVFTEPLRRPAESLLHPYATASRLESMVAEFLAGVIVGVLIGLAIAPVLRTWILWQTAKSMSRTSSSPDDASIRARSER